MQYTLTISRYGRRLGFDTLEALRDELKQYFTPREIAGGIVDRLTTFSMKDQTENNFSYKYGETNYRDMKICCYDFE